MAATTKLGEIETVVRRDLVKDDNPDQYRWSSFQIASAVFRAIRDTVNVNAWAEFDQETCRRIVPTFDRTVVGYCEADPKSLAETASFVVGGQTMNIEQFLAYLRSIVLPIDDRWHDAVAYFAAFHVLDSAGADTEYLRRAAQFLQVAKENAAL